MQETLQKALRAWFKKNATELPWRLSDLQKERDPYAVWISETMLQQTQVSTVRDYFVRWMKRFPTVEKLAKADEAEVFRYWQGLGYYSRAKNILRTAKLIAEAGGKFPETRKELEALPGIGAYTAGAILSLAYHKREAILDGNLVRIFSRLYELAFLPIGKNESETYWDYARKWADAPKGYMHNEALMELGRTVCKAKNPQCGGCPLAVACQSFKDGRIPEFPPTKKRTQKDWHGTVLVVESTDGKILAVRGGQAFLEGQLSLPHFESARMSTAGLPAKAEAYVNADDVESVTDCGSFRHNITVHKIECDVLHVRLKRSSKSRKLADTYSWLPKAKASEMFANSFSLKALERLADRADKA